METSLSQALASELKKHIADNEDWLVKRVLYYAKKNGYTAYTSTLEEAWRASIAGLSKPLLETPANSFWMLGLNPHFDFAEDEFAKFGVEEAIKHRKRGIDLVMFLGLFKYYRQSFEDLLYKLDMENDDLQSCRKFIKRYFDRVELGFISSWTKQDSEKLNDELVQSNRELSNEKNLYLTTIESINQPVVVFTEKSDVRIINQAAAVLFGGQSIAGGVYYGTQSVDVNPLLKKKAEDFLANHKISQETILAVAGRVFDVSFSRMKDVSGKFLGLIAVLNDITDKRNTQNYLKESEALRRAFMEGLGAAAVVLDMESRIVVDFNLKAEELFAGCNFNDCGVRFFEELGGEVSNIFELAEKSVNNEERFIEICKNTSKPVRLFTVEVWFQQKRHKIVIIFDISKEKILEKRASHLQQLEMLGEIAGSLPDMLSSHIKSLCRTIESMEEFAPKGDCAVELKRVENDLAEINSVIDALHSLVGRDGDSECIDINQLIENCVLLTKFKWYPYADVSLDLCLKRKSVICMPDEMGQVFLILLANAAYAIRKKSEADGRRGLISISSRCVGNIFEVKISDTGIGIKKADYKRVFDHSYTNKQLGRVTGNGLAIVYDTVVKRHKGTIQFKSVEHEGTEFIIKLPLN